MIAIIALHFVYIMCGSPILFNANGPIGPAGYNYAKTFKQRDLDII